MNALGFKVIVREGLPPGTCVFCSGGKVRGILLVEGGEIMPKCGGKEVKKPAPKKGAKK